MSTQKFILRSVQQSVRESPETPVLAWVPGTVQPFSSLWILAQRFAILNRPSKLSFEKNFGLLKKTKGPCDFATVWEPPSLELQHSQALGIAQLLGEEPDAVEHARISQFPRAMQPLFNPELWWCCQCLNGGYHTELFSLVGLEKCPHHGTRLVMSCRCGRRVRHDDFAACLAWPGHCTCGARFLDAKRARSPAVLPARDVCLKELHDWIVAATRRVWFQIPDKLTTYPMSIKRHLKEWEQALVVIPPPTTWCVPSDVQMQQTGPWSPQLHLTSVAPSRSVSRQVQMAALGGDFSCAPIFKSLKRYIAHHVLVHGRHWITSLAMSSDRDKITSLIQCADRARKAWTMLLWWQGCVRSLSLRDWFRPCRPDFNEEKAFERDVLSRGGGDLDWLSAAELRWIQCHLYVASLMFLWDRAHRVTNEAVAGFGATWGWGAASDCYPLHPQTCRAPGWSCVKDERGRLGLLVDTPCVKLTAAPQVDKSVRRTQTMQLEETRRVDLRACCERTCIWYHSRTQDWLVHAGPTPKVPLDYVRRRLGGGARQIFCLVFHVNEHGSGEFVARCLSLPIAASADTPRAAIAALKMVVQRYRKQLVVNQVAAPMGA